MPPSVDIIAALSASLKQASTQSLDISFNELLDMASSGELNITPSTSGYSDGQRGNDQDLSNPFSSRCRYLPFSLSRRRRGLIN